MSVLPFYIREMGGSPLIIGIIIATEAFSQFCAAPLIGHLSDRVGRKRILIVTLAIAAISLLLLASAQPMVWATTLAFFSYNYILFFFLTWFPSYLNHSLHLDIKEISIATVIPWVIGAIGMVLGGVYSDVIYRITGNALLSRRLILGVCLAGAAVCVAISGTVSTIGSAITLMSVSLFLLYLTGPIYWAVIQDVVHKDKVGSVGGAMHGLANISGIIGPLVTGFIVQFSGKYDYAFYLAGAIAIVSSLLVFVFVKSKGFKANESQSCVH
ncbi:MFS transporter [Salmonella enterica subsp. salamae]|nr:MFS transporter [Salmonella enterica subsp. salamae]